VVAADDPEPYARRDTVEELRQENERLRRAEGRGRSQRWRRRWKSIVSWVLIVVACLLAVLSVFVVFVRNEVLNTDTYVSTVTPLASNPAIQSAVAKRVTDQLVTKINVEYRVKRALPGRAGFLATPIATAVQAATNDITLKLVESSKFQELWVEANRRAHKQVVALLTGSGEGALQSSNGKVTVDLGHIEGAAKQALRKKGITLFDKVSTTNGPTLTLFQSTQLVRLQGLIRLLNRLYILLPIVTLLVFAGGILLTRNRRRGLVRAAAGLAVSMAVVLLVASVGRAHYLSSLSPSQSRPATEAVIDTISASLLDTVRTIFVVAAVIAVVAVIVGNSSVRAWVGKWGKPSWMTGGPAHDVAAAHRKGLQWAVIGLGLLLLVVWNQPTALIAVVIVLVALALVAFIGLLAGRGSNSGSDSPGRGPGDGAPAVGPGSGGEGPVAALGPGHSDDD
jgi:hypothetical protein